jgi:K+-sensing histidine kinase KdpD
LSYAALAMLVHDFKVPLSTVALDTRLLLRQLDDGDHDDMVRAISRVLLNVDYLDRMVHELIEAARLEDGRLALHREPTELRELVETIVKRWGVALKRERIIIEALEQAVVHVDSLRVERVLANLLHNALVYSPKDSRVVVRIHALSSVARVTIRNVRTELSSELASQLDGCGMFSTSDGGRGSGLGLWISRQIVDAHGGRLGVSFPSDDGFEVYVELPMR